MRLGPSLALAALSLSAAAAPRVARAADACTPSRLMVLLDKSSSMRTGTIGGVTKWSIAVDALEAVVSSYQDVMEIGLMIFPSPNQCSPGSVFVEPALGSRDAVLDALGDPPPTGGNYTPISQTLEAAAVEPSLLATDTNRYVVLITDGWQWCDPYDPSTRYDPVDAVAGLNAAGVTTYVVGFGAAVDTLTLNAVAVAAGTARPGCDPTGDAPTDPKPCYYQANDPDALVDALFEIANAATAETCDGLDNDCDGLVDEDLARDCETACGAGTETCSDGSWGGCDAPATATESCDGVDNDCDGVTDPGCDCTSGDTRTCGDEPTVGACHPGTQTCGLDGTWGDCEGRSPPQNEMCDGLDNDCDGRADESDDDVGSLCGPGFDCRDGSCVPTDPVTPPDEQDPPADEPTPAADGGQPGSCACRTGGRTDGGSLAGGLLLIGLVALASRRRPR
jgi:MYXO-CTERM domain-containing protein